MRRRPGTLLCQIPILDDSHRWFYSSAMLDARGIRASEKVLGGRVTASGSADKVLPPGRTYDSIAPQLASGARKTRSAGRLRPLRPAGCCRRLDAAGLLPEGWSPEPTVDSESQDCLILVDRLGLGDRSSQGTALDGVLMPSKSPRCPICSHPSEFELRAPDHHYGNEGTWDVFRCGTCRHLFQDPMPTEEALARLYPEAYYAHQSPNTNFEPRGFRHRGVWLTMHYLKAFRSYDHLPVHKLPLLARFAKSLRFKPLHFGAPPYRHRGTLLDYGSGSGDAVAFMKYLGWEAEGIELSPAAVAAGRNAGLAIHHGSVGALEDRPARYDYIMSSHCVEHVPDVVRDPGFA